MAKIERTTQKIFGGDAGTHQFTAFGTAMTENPVYTKDIAEIQNGASYLSGWSEAVLPDLAPFMEDMNAYMYMVTTQLAYIMQQGAAIEWDANTTYYKGSIVAAANGTGNWYKSLKDDNTSPLSDATAWQQLELSKNGTPLFSQITTDYVLTGNDAIGWAMQGSQVSNSIYPEAYAKILNLYNNGSAISYRGITAKRTTDGRYIADISQQNALNTLFNNTGVADCYVIDTLGQSFYLPKTARYIQYTTDTNAVNQFNDSGLPELNLNGNITINGAGNHAHNRGDMEIYAGFFAGGAVAPAASVYGGGAINAWKAGESGAAVAALGYGTGDIRFDFYASRHWTGNTSWSGDHTHSASFNIDSSNPIYGNQTYVQPPSSLKLLYYRVGNTAV